MLNGTPKQLWLGKPLLNEKLRRDRVNVDLETARGFGDEWSRFTQSELSTEQRKKMFEDYFAIFPWDRLPAGGGVGADIGCGTGRWSMLVAPRVSRLHLVDVSAQALQVARKNLSHLLNVEFHHASVGELPFWDDSLDFAFSLGVLHHVPDTRQAITAIARTLKRGAPFLVYLYYSFDNRPPWFRLLWRLSEVGRFAVSRLPYPLRYAASQVIAVLVYYPLARFARVLEKLGLPHSSWPLSYYRDKSFYTMRTDALDRFGTRLEKRFARKEIEAMLIDAGLVDIRFSKNPPFWCAVGIKS